jgi:gliding motility-associated-like protein
MSDPGATGFWWDFGTGFPADSSVLANPTFTYPSYGIYTVTLIAQKGTVCETEATLEISLSDLTADFISPDTVCQNTTIDFEDNSETLEGTTITGWEWDFGDLTTSDLENPSHTYDIPGDYLVQLVVTNNVGCTDTLVKSLHVQNQPVVDAGEDVSVCLGDPSVELDGNILFAESGIWSGTGGVFSPSNTNLNATYFPSLDEIDLGYSEIVLTSVGNGSCEAVTDTMLIIYLGFPEVNAGLDIDVCEDSTYVILDATTNFGSTILWTTAGDGTFSDDEALNATYTFGPGDIIDGEIILYIATNNSGCPNVNDSLTITINPPPTLTALSDTTLCSRQSLYLISDVSTENGIWSTSGDGTFDPETGPWTNYTHGLGDLALGAVTIFFESTDNGGCFAVYDTIQVDILPSPEANFEFTEVCFGTPTEFINTSTSEDPIITNFWTFEPGITSAILNPSHSFSSGGTFDVQLVVISENGCADTLIQDVRSHFIPAVDFDIPYPCLNGGTYFYDSTQIGAGIITEWAWDFGDGSAIDTSQNPIHQYPSQGAYDITLTVSSEFGCTADTMITTLINLGPIAAFTANPPSANLFVNINFTDQSVPNGSPLTYWEWHFGDGDSSFTQNTIHQYDFEGEYNVELIVKDELGCIDTANNIVPIYHGPLVASAFSPNGDNNNDFLMILGGNYSDIDFKIYNNWGQLIFETKDPQSLGWDGTFKDEPQPLGVYVYVAKVVTYDGVEHVISGDVSLIR